MKDFPLTSFAILLVIAVCWIMNANFKTWEKREGVVEDDIHHYYGYLPAAFIFGDLKIEKKNYPYGANASMFWTVKAPNQGNVFRMSMGLAYLYSPFFFTAHYYSKLAGEEPNGYSTPYHLALLLSTVVFMVIGLIYSAKILIQLQFNDKITAITLLAIALGTNLLCYSTLTAPMPHAYNFCLFAIFFYYILKWEISKSIGHTIILSLLFGLITLIRPSNAVIAVFFIPYYLFEIKGALNFRFILRSIIIAFICISIVWLPQLLYWKYVTGQYIFYSYIENGFNFDNPQIINGLFSFRKGWLIYTPIMVFALAGIYFLKDDLAKFRVPLLFFLVVNIYVIYSWWCWWYGGSYGSRPMIDSYGLLILPLAAIIRVIASRNWLIKSSALSLLLFFIWLNIFQTIQFKNTALHWDSMTRELYFKQFGKLMPIPGNTDYLDYPVLPE